MELRRATACLIVEVTVSALPEAGPHWKPGPLPVRLLWPDEGHLAAVAADREARLTYVEPRLTAALYGDGTARSTRWHRGTVMSAGRSEVIGTELLLPPAEVGGGAWGLAVLHLRLGDTPLDELAGLADLSAVSRQGRTRREEIDALLPPGTVTAAGAPRPFVLSHTTFPDAPPARVMGAAYDAWPPSDQWLWLAASATPVRRFPPDPDDTDLFDGRVRFSADWQSLVLRDGAAFVGLTPDPGDGTGFHPVARTLVHSLYLDVFLLGTMQRKVVNDLANDVAAATEKRLDHPDLPRLEERLVRLRNALGAEWMTLRGKGNDLLRAYRRQHHLAEATSYVVQNLTDSADFARAAGARSLNAALGLLTVVGLPFGLAYAAGALSGRTGTVPVVVCTLAAIVCSLILLLGIRPVRGLFRAARRPR